jgi:MOSC domain-containing protein YiiM
MAELLSVNLGSPKATEASDVGVTGIDKRPVREPVEVRAPGPRQGGLGSGLVGDRICDTDHHGGDDQAVYAYAREDYDIWQAELGRPLTSGMFGDNLTTSGLDITGALIGERWQVGDQVLLEVALPRIPCRTFAGWMEEERWVKRFTIRALPGAYLRVVTPGVIRVGDPIAVVERPDHDVTVGVTFRALTREPELLPRLLAVDALPERTKEKARQRATPASLPPR